MECPQVPVPCLLWPGEYHHTPNTDAPPVFTGLPGQGWAWRWLILMNEAFYKWRQVLSQEWRVSMRVWTTKGLSPNVEEQLWSSGPVFGHCVWFCRSRPSFPARDSPRAAPPSLCFLTSPCTCLPLLGFVLWRSFLLPAPYLLSPSSPCLKCCQLFPDCQDCLALPLEHFWNSDTPR